MDFGGPGLHWPDFVLGINTSIDIGERVTRIDIGPFHFVHYPTDGYVPTPSSREFVIAEAQPTNFAFLLDLIFRNLKVVAALIPVVILLALFSSSLRFRSKRRSQYHEVRRGRLPLFLVGAIIIVVAAGVYAFWADTKAEGSAALLAPPGPVCIPKRDSAKTAVVLIHGWNGDDTSWRRFPELLCKDEDFFDTEVFVVNYPTYMARRQLTIYSLGRWLRQTFFSDALRNFQEIHIIAHSMGGLVARSIYLDDKLAASKIRSINSIASPYEGADLAKLAKALGISKDYTKDMAPDSKFINTLADRWTDVDPKPVTYCFTSPTDGVVTSLSAKRQCDCTHDYPQWNHIDLVKPVLRTDERYYMPIRGLKNAIAAHQLPPSAGHPQCFSLARSDEYLKLVARP
ncbi:MAG: hypothetical protein CR217_01445 [Beijerinckiaceae bacterium]|nr:MAG: hypothetical protein CR217_01445 [Beijerinckiaceae bacterium]